ncbi:MAG TPA: transketolase [Candidatus Limnocylindrales bacterium]|nr:transketolase [Candidatus Limnocylindrales bacterium]
MATTAATGTRLDLYRDVARQLRADSIRSSSAAGSGHPTSSLSAADIMAVLLAGHFLYDWKKPEDPANDHLIFSKGHASPLVYAMFRAAGVIDDKELLTFRRLGSPLQGHPTPMLPWVDVATGSLGQGMPIAVGMGLAAKRLWNAPFHIWTLVGDSESAEGSIWEGFDLGGHEGTNNVTPIIDVNRLGQRGPTELEWDTDAYAARVEAFGWESIVIDGHDLAEIDEALSRARDAERPTAIIARTVKGKGVSFIEDQPGWHGKTLDPEQTKKALAEIGDEPSRTFETRKPDAWRPPAVTRSKPALKVYTEPVATRKAYGDALAAVVAAQSDVVALDAEVSNSTHADEVKKVAPERFFEMYIAEQKMVAAAVGMQVIGLRPFASTFAAFLTRAYDFIRMAAISQANIRLSGSHAGVSIGEDGPSQMALEDLAMMRAVHGSTVLYPSDGNQTARLVAAMADRDGIVYMRTTRANTPILYPATEEFAVGGSRVVRGGGADDKVTVVAAGITLHESVKAADVLAKTGVKVRLIDLYSVKPVDTATLAAAVTATAGRLVVVEDHWPEGGLGEAVLAALAASPGTGGRASPELVFRHLAPREMPGSGKPAELLHAAGIDADCIEKAVRGLI